MKKLSIGLNSTGLNDTASALNFELTQGQIPDWIELVPAGPKVEGRDGRTWLNDRPDDIVAAFNSDGRSIPIDFEHSTELKAPNGDPAPASAWVDKLETRNQSIWGHVDWNENGKTAVMNREYRYYSPVFIYEKNTGRIVRLTSVGLTNRPNLRVTALNHQKNEECNMDWLEELLKALGLAPDCKKEVAINHVEKMKTDLTKAQTDLAVALNRADTPSLDKFVPRGDYNAALTRATNAENSLAELKKADLEKEITTEIDAALKAGKITPATKDYHTARCRETGGLDEFKKFLAVAPVIGDPSKLDEVPPKTGTALNAEQAQILERLGISKEEFDKVSL